MNVSLTQDLDGFVRQQVEAGRYQSSSELIREALRLFQDRERYRELKIATLKAEIERGIASGPAEPLDFDAIRKAARAKLALLQSAEAAERD